MAFYCHNGRLLCDCIGILGDKGQSAGLCRKPYSHSSPVVPVDGKSYQRHHDCMFPWPMQGAETIEAQEPKENVVRSHHCFRPDAQGEICMLWFSAGSTSALVQASEDLPNMKRYIPGQCTAAVSL